MLIALLQQHYAFRPLQHRVNHPLPPAMPCVTVLPCAALCCPVSGVHQVLCVRWAGHGQPQQGLSEGSSGPQQAEAGGGQDRPHAAVLGGVQLP